MTKLDEALREARGTLEPGEPEILMAHVLGSTRSWLYAHGDSELPRDVVERFAALVADRRDGIPVAYLTGRRGFRDLDLAVTPATLIPRPETELLVELALARLPAGVARRIADLGTGSGAIALALARARPEASVIATDESRAALDVARANARRLGLGNIAFAAGHWWEAVADTRFALVASNPPYIAEGDPHLVQGDLRHEPRDALVSGVDGLDAIREIAAGAVRHLEPGGWLLVEHGWAQGAAVRALFVDAGLGDVATARDLEGRERVTRGCLRR